MHFQIGNFVGSIAPEKPEQLLLGMPFDAWVAAFTALLFVATLVLAIATFRLAWGADRAAEVQNRAYVGVTFNETRATYDEETGRLTATATFVNNGQTPARRVRSGAGLRGGPKFAAAWHDEISALRSGGLGSTNNIGPGRQMKIPIDVTMSLAERDEVLARRSRVWFFAQADYSDVYGKPHVTRARAFLKPESLATLPRFLNAEEGNDET